MKQWQHQDLGIQHTSNPAGNYDQILFQIRIQSWYAGTVPCLKAEVGNQLEEDERMD